MSISGETSSDVALGERIVRYRVDVRRPCERELEGVGTVAAGQNIVAAAAFENVIAGSAIDDLVRRAADQDVIAGGAIDDVLGKAPSAFPVEPPVPKLLSPEAGLMIEFLHRAVGAEPDQFVAVGV